MIKHIAIKKDELRLTTIVICFEKTLLIFGILQAKIRNGCESNLGQDGWEKRGSACSQDSINHLGYCHDNILTVRFSSYRQDI